LKIIIRISKYTYIYMLRGVRVVEGADLEHGNKLLYIS
jgi:hypothetical protein